MLLLHTKHRPPHNEHPKKGRYAMKQKSKKMLISLVLALLLTFHCTIPALGAAFPDVTRTSVGEEIFDAINYVTDNGIMNGMDTGNF